MVLYRKYRPQTFADLVGREAIASALLAQLESGKIGHGYLFYGTRGTGKTSAARILAKSVNCEKYQRPGKNNTGHGRLATSQLTFGEPCNKCLSCTSIADGSNLDLIEIDAASNRGIDEIRDLREKVKLSPVSSRFKVYIIDEAHMLTNEAFNALLKTLEEPPAHAIFILATTEYTKLPATIVSRLQKFNFTKATKADIVTACKKICKAEGINVDDEALMTVAESADGSFRDAVSLLDQISGSKGKITKGDVLKIAKTSGASQIYDFLENLATFKLKEAVGEIEKVVDAGGDIVVFARQVVQILEKVLLVKIGIVEATSDLELDDKSRIEALAANFDSAKLRELIRLIIASEQDIKLYPMGQIPLVLAICKYGEGEERQRDKETEKISGPSPRAEDIKGGNKQNVEGKNEEPEQIKRTQNKSDFGRKPKKSRGTGKLEDIEKNWPEFLNRVRPINAHVVALLKSTKPTEFDGQNLTLEVFYRFHKDKLEEPKIVGILDSVLADVMGAPVRLKFSLAARESAPTVVVGKSDVVDVKAEELEQIAQEIFSK